MNNQICQKQLYLDQNFLDLSRKRPKTNLRFSKQLPSKANLRRVYPFNCSSFRLKQCERS